MCKRRRGELKAEEGGLREKRRGEEKGKEGENKMGFPWRALGSHPGMIGTTLFFKLDFPVCTPQLPN